MSESTEVNESNENVKLEASKDPSLFLFLWLGLPMITMIGYAFYLLNFKK